MVSKESPGSALRSWRERKKLHQEDLAAVLGTTQSTISRIENGRCVPDIDLAVRIARHCRIPVARWTEDQPAATGTGG